MPNVFGIVLAYLCSGLCLQSVPAQGLEGSKFAIREALQSWPLDWTHKLPEYKELFEAQSYDCTETIHHAILSNKNDPSSG